MYYQHHTLSVHKRCTICAQTVQSVCTACALTVHTTQSMVHSHTVLRNCNTCTSSCAAGRNADIRIENVLLHLIFFAVNHKLNG